MTEKRRVLGFLQNAWSPKYAGKEWPREQWLNALAASRSGQRLATLTILCPNLEFCWENTTPIVGAHPDSRIPADPVHMMALVGVHNPHMILAFGNQAHYTIRVKLPALLIAKPLIFLPHPAYRVLTNKLLAAVARRINEGFQGLLEFRQRRRRFHCIHTIEP